VNTLAGEEFHAGYLGERSMKSILAHRGKLSFNLPIHLPEHLQAKTITLFFGMSRRPFGITQQYGYSQAIGR
jgi:hypothetical protein